jgi:hypothetical protein
MKKLVMLLALAVAFSLSGFAQASGSTSSSSSGDTAKSDTAKSDKKAAKADKMGGKTITGCLKSDSTPVTISNAKKKDVEVDTSGASSEDWAKHNGHKVQLTGSWDGPKFKATAMKHVSETCTVGGKASAAGGKKGKKDKAAGDANKTPS